MLLSGKVALVTGANRGIGKSIAEQYISEGAIVYANARKLGSLDEMAATINAKGNGKLVPVYFDVTDISAMKSAIMRIRKESGHLNILVNNAGLMSNQRLGFITMDETQKLFDTNVFAVIQLIQFASKIMVEDSSIINISSIVGQRGNAGQLLYSATKGAVIALTKSAAKELAPRHIRVNSVAPGLTMTDGLNSTQRKYLEGRIQNIPYGRLAFPKDIASACVFLASDLSIYISGEVLGVNGSAIM